MTAIRDRRNETGADETEVPWDERPIFGDRRGLPWWGAVLLGFGVALIAAVINLMVADSLGWLFYACYVIASIAAVAAVRRRSLFGPMIQPPLVLAITVPVVVATTGIPANSDMLAKAIKVGTPLINGFPVMAITTGITLLLGIWRLYRERDPRQRTKDDRPRERSKDRPRQPAPSDPDVAVRPSGRDSGRQRLPVDRDEPPRRRPADAERGAPPVRGEATGTARRPRPGEERGSRRIPPESETGRRRLPPEDTGPRPTRERPSREAGPDDQARANPARGRANPPRRRGPNDPDFEPPRRPRRPPAGEDPRSEPPARPRAPRGRKEWPPRNRPWNNPDQ